MRQRGSSLKRSGFTTLQPTSIALNHLFRRSVNMLTDEELEASGLLKVLRGLHPAKTTTRAIPPVACCPAMQRLWFLDCVMVSASSSRAKSYLEECIPTFSHASTGVEQRPTAWLPLPSRSKPGAVDTTSGCPTDRNATRTNYQYATCWAARYRNRQRRDWNGREEARVRHAVGAELRERERDRLGQRCQ